MPGRKHCLVTSVVSRLLSLTAGPQLRISRREKARERDPGWE